MGSETNRQSRVVPTKARSSISKQNRKQHTAIKQAAKKRPQQWSKDRSERVRDALNRDAALLYNVLESPYKAPSPIAQTDSIVSLAETLQGLGR